MIFQKLNAFLNILDPQSTIQMGGGSTSTPIRQSFWGRSSNPPPPAQTAGGPAQQQQQQQPLPNPNNFSYIRPSTWFSS